MRWAGKRVFMKSHISFLGALLLACVVTFTASVVMIILASRTEDSFRAQALNSRAALEELNGVVSNALSAETGQRGYFLTGDTSYLEPYEAGIRDLKDQLAEFEALKEGSLTASQQETLVELHQAVDVKITEMSQTLELYRAGDVRGALALVRNDTGKQAMDQVRALTANLNSQEQEVLAHARHQSQVSRTRVLQAVSMLSLISMIGFFAAYRNLNSARKLDVVEQHARELSDERERTDLLARELSHRVKNLFLIVQSIISATARQETDAKVAAAKIRERVHALSQAHSLTSSLDLQQKTTLAELTDMIVGAQVTGTCTLKSEGPLVSVSAQHVTPLGMILHELTTNAVKYGAWSADNGHINVTWKVRDPVKDQHPSVEVYWEEICGPGANCGERGPDGFGSRMINLSLSQLRGQSTRNWKPEGLSVTITLPIDDEGALLGRNNSAT